MRNEDYIDHQYGEEFERALAHASLLDDQESYAESEKIYAEVIRRCPDLPYAYAKRGFAMEKQGKFREAVDDYSAAITRKPNSPVTTWRRALAYEHLDMLDEAKADYFQYLALKGPDADAFLAISSISAFLGHTNAALEFGEKAAALSPEDEKVQGWLRLLRSERVEGG